MQAVINRRILMDTKPALESSLVEEFVRVAHSDLQRTRELLEQEPGLVNASWDWGGGDFETALGSDLTYGQAGYRQLPA